MQHRSRLQRVGTYFPTTVFRWEERHTYVGEEIGHLWFSSIIGKDSYGNLLVTWRGPMDVRLEYVRDQTERLQWGEGARISGPDLFHIVAEFPQIGNDLVLMYAFQAMLADGLATRVAALGKEVAVRGTDVYAQGAKLTVGVCAASATSCTMHFGVNISLKGELPVPRDVKAGSLSDLVGGDEARAVRLMEEVASSWLSRIDEIYRKAYKTA